MDQFYHPKKKKSSRTFKICYRSWDEVLTKKDVNILHDKISSEAVDKLNVVLR